MNADILYNVVQPAKNDTISETTLKPMLSVCQFIFNVFFIVSPAAISAKTVCTPGLKDAYIPTI